MTFSVVSWTLGITEVDPLVDKLKALGLNGVQYAGDHRDVHPGELRRKTHEAGIRIIAIDPFNAAPAHPDQASSATAIEYYKRVVDFAVMAGAVPVTLHGLSLWTRNCPDAASARQRLVECCKSVDTYARERGIRTLYEVCNHYEVPLIHTAAQCHALMEEVGGGNMGMILDSFHMNINEPDPLRTLRENARQLAIYHISDSGRGGIGTGHIDFAAQHAVLKEGGFTGEVAVEPVLEHLTPSNAPSSDADRQRLDRQVVNSAQTWRGYEAGQQQCRQGGS
ncbi:sugar phosphate isomerase/epimerase [Pseudomonas capeferrum]|uniref:sugar phosphate isomerase/epimerase family protein n=1 Tax=Pseudomonas capeferrum TaxID=1495066 RepID=UPI0015E4368C|nr:sugar phosphate isomerase/epimerase family protein [Pseudomonas capeferrum]MBA1200338.1 sugar phosphate isomerase/epimerase [Pseudomonas capeferrum]